MMSTPSDHPAQPNPRPAHIPYEHQRLAPAVMLERARALADAMERRRSVRDFSSEAFPLRIVDDAIRAAASGPSGAHQQPWTFVVVSDAETKREIREAAEVEERKNWDGRMSPEWVRALAPLGVDWRKEHLTTAPVLIVVFAQAWGSALDEEGALQRRKHYYVDESVGIAVGILLAVLHLSGLVTLTHTPSPMGFLRKLLGRPENERAYVVIPVGYPAADARVPNLERKALEAVRVHR